MEISEPNSKNDEFNVKNIHFIYKLWIITNCYTNDIINWSREGDYICIDIVKTTKYLSDEISIFHCKTLKDFKSCLMKQNFYQLDEAASKSEAEATEFLNYKNSNFIKGNFGLLKNLVKLSSEGNKNSLQTQAQYPNQNTTEIQATKITHRILPKIELKAQKQLFLTIKLKKKMCLDILRRQEFPYNQSSVIPVPADIFKWSSTSVSNFDENSEYAGFYGPSVKINELKNIFADYLPVYLKTEKDSDIYEMEADVQENQSLHMADENQPNSLAADDNDLQLKIATENLTKATTLEPILIQDSMDTNNEDDISMDSYLKFNEKGKDDAEKIEQTSDVIKEESIDTTEADICHMVDKTDSAYQIFKSFFSAYSNSINVLLDE